MIGIGSYICSICGQENIININALVEYIDKHQESKRAMKESCTCRYTIVI